MPVFKMRLRTILVLVALVAMLLGFFQYGKVTLGIGHATLKIAFVVTDALTSRPIDGATIEFLEEDFLPATVVVRATGQAGKLIRECQAKVISRHTWRESTHATRPPDITFRSSAPGYGATAWMPLDSIEHRKSLGSDHPTSTLDVKITLLKRRPDATKSAERILP